MSKKKTEEEQFKYEMSPETGCWLWLGTIDAEGYGRIKCDIMGKRKKLLAHRYSYSKYNGPIPGGLLICHKCDNPRCVNPEHLFLGTQADNMRDMGKKKRARSSKKTTCPKNHPYDRTSNYQTGIRRVCGICKKEQWQRSYAKRLSKLITLPKRSPTFKRDTEPKD